MALAYTAPTWTDGSGEGISASNLQAISDCIEGLVQGSDKAITAILIDSSGLNVTYADGSIENFPVTDLKGIASIAKTSTSGRVDTYTITYTDGSTSSFTVTNGQDGTDGRDGVIQYTAGNGITIASDTITADVQSVSVAESGTASHMSYRMQRVVVNGVANEIKGTKYMEYTANASIFEFQENAIQSSSVIDVYTDTWGDNPTSVTVSLLTCTVTFAEAKTRTVRIYIK